MKLFFEESRRSIMLSSIMSLSLIGSVVVENEKISFVLMMVVLVAFALFLRMDQIKYNPQKKELIIYINGKKEKIEKVERIFVENGVFKFVNIDGGIVELNTGKIKMETIEKIL